MDVFQAHRFSSGHRAQIEASEVCACFYCFAQYPPTAIDNWTDNGTTACCPECFVDSVIGSASGVPLDEAFLRRMHAEWF